MELRVVLLFLNIETIRTAFVVQLCRRRWNFYSLARTGFAIVFGFCFVGHVGVDECVEENRQRGLMFVSRYDSLV